MLRASAIAALAVVSSAKPMGDLIKTLPGWDAPLPSHHFSGYLNASATKHLHYYFVECEDPDVDAPTVLWFNGGPGCSSLDGLVYEHGPFRINGTDNSLYRFDFTWAKVANMLYIEAPVGVGFSYSDTPEDYGKCNDDNTALDNLAAVEFFFKQFPEHAKKPFYITGESYAGVYVPTLAEAVLNAVKAGTYTGAPLTGIAVGNGCSGTEIGVCGGQGQQFRTEFLLEHAFMPRSLKNDIRAECDWTKKGPQSLKCSASLAKMGETIGHIDLYNVYGPCISGSGHPDDQASTALTQAQTLAQHIRSRDARTPDVGLGGPDACIDSITASDYFNQPEVQAALHVVKPKQRWAVCGSEPGWNYQSVR